ncbi:reverse transcriptase domain-containing protein [Tanacetum coccineum]|uniref:Reverse transcriptase domain-containing protein n=1 Tax=Tanacetum coccineum TaxID=301880 RepID=A0ABQ5DDZ7_9ASTR
MNFMVVRSPSPYNGIFGRPGFRKLQAIPSTAHEMLKISVEGGVITLKSSKLVPLECAVVSRPEGAPSSTKPIIEERIKVEVNPEYPEQTVMIGSTPPRKVATTSQDTLAVHRLKRAGGMFPVRQKKRGIATDRNQAILRGIGKLVEAGNIEGSYYYNDWLSHKKKTQVMVKKHDDSWRMCVDFKDLNKACPKDGYPLPKIDLKAEEAFKQIKQLIAELPMLTAPMEKEELIVYLAATKETVSAVLMTEREAKQMPIYFVNRALRGPELNYTSMEKLVMALVHASKRLKRPEEDSPDTLIEEKKELPEPWILFTDGSLTVGSGARNNTQKPKRDGVHVHLKGSDSTATKQRSRYMKAFDCWTKDSGTNRCEKPSSKCGFTLSGQLSERNVLTSFGEIFSDNGKPVPSDPFKDWTNGLVKRATDLE